MEFKPTIGLEIHVELKTRSKMFCDCKNEPEIIEPNINICPVCLGMPGTLPTANKTAIDWTLKTGLALNCEIQKNSKFDRKNYFYPDLPKGYQISQYDMPFCKNGYLKISGRKIRTRRVHLEEDTAKLFHIDTGPLGVSSLGSTPLGVGEVYSLIDYNRAGVPLMEIVTEPDLLSAKEAREFAQKLRLVLRYLSVSNANMEKGQMRVEANISLSNQNKLGTKVEIKNLNSFKSVEKAVNFEIQRQTELLESGEKIIHETRGWHDQKQITFSQRSKETAPDYRYFPEPDLPTFEFNQQIISDIKADLPELPDDKSVRFRKDYQLSKDDIGVLISNLALANYFEEVCLSKVNPQKVANWLITELLAKMKVESVSFSEIKIKPHDLANLVMMIEKGELTGKIAKDIFKTMFESGENPTQIMADSKIELVSGENELKTISLKIIKKNPQLVKDYQDGKKQVIQFFIGQIMKETRGMADPEKAKSVLQKELLK
ncbi:MAG TPA: Asp-tRNA(Asn)/Glu-tRNA(Gln) amidotransferase subunit GatB [Patescibacteria group bacterium]|nr:Asp-tRNA(Asn)/Glu-tRNA(Gln) amidotransferase subunit GatB [Patescibacteria group bacterium]